MIKMDKGKREKKKIMRNLGRQIIYSQAHIYLFPFFISYFRRW